MEGELFFSLENKGFSNYIVMSSDEEDVRTSHKLDALIKQLTEFSSYTRKKLEDNHKAINQVLELQERQSEELKSLKRENLILKEKIEYLERKGRNTEKQALANTITFYPIPRVKDEDLSSVIKKIGKAVDVTLSSFNIVQVFRRRDRKDGKPGDVVLTCNTNAVKSSLVDLIKQKNINLSDIGFNDKSQKLYANYELTWDDKNLFYTALKNKRNQNWSYVWNSKGNILIRVKEGEKPVKINSMVELEKLMKDV